MCKTRNPQITRKNKLTVFQQYLKKEESDEVDLFLHADKHNNFLQIDTMIFDEIVKHSQSPKIASLQSRYSISKKNLEMKLISTLWASKLPA